MKDAKLHKWDTFALLCKRESQQLKVQLFILTSRGGHPGHWKISYDRRKRKPALWLPIKCCKKKISRFVFIPGPVDDLEQNQRVLGQLQTSRWASLAQVHQRGRHFRAIAVDFSTFWPMPCSNINFENNRLCDIISQLRRQPMPPSTNVRWAGRHLNAPANL